MKETARWVSYTFHPRHFAPCRFLSIWLYFGAWMRYLISDARFWPGWDRGGIAGFGRNVSSTYFGLNGPLRLQQYFWSHTFLHWVVFLIHFNNWYRFQFRHLLRWLTAMSSLSSNCPHFSPKASRDQVQQIRWWVPGYVSRFICLGAFPHLSYINLSHPGSSCTFLSF